MKTRILWLLLMISYGLPNNALTINRVIVACDNNPLYLQFWPLVAKTWQQVVGITPTLILVSDEDISLPEVPGEIYRVGTITGVPASFEAQVIRLLIPALFENDVCLISDMDMIPLQRDYFINSVAAFPDDRFITFKDGAFDTDYFKEYPMCYNVALGKTFKEIFNISTIEQIGQKIREWYGLRLGWTTDQQILYKEVNTWHAQTNRLVKLGHDVHPRVDRINWQYESRLLKQSYYIDAHLLRPYNQYKDAIDQLMGDLEEVVQQYRKRDQVPQPMVKGRKLNDANYGTHMIPLVNAVVNTKGPILELGAGDFSTPLLHALCKVHKRMLISTDTDQKWLNYFRDLETDWHQFIYVPVYSDDQNANPHPERWDTIGANTHWSVVLVDHRPGERRKIDIERLRPHTDIFVIHDTQQPAYNYESVIRTFKYKYVYERYETTTTLVSDTVDVATLF